MPESATSAAKPPFDPRDVEFDPRDVEFDPRDAESDAQYERSGKASTDDPLVSFLYDLLRDELPAGVVERLARNAVVPTTLTNGWLAAYAQDVARRLLTIKDRPTSVVVGRGAGEAVGVDRDAAGGVVVRLGSVTLAFEDERDAELLGQAVLGAIVRPPRRPR